MKKHENEPKPATSSKTKAQALRINTIVGEKYLNLYLELKKKGTICSVPELIRRSLDLYSEHIVNEEMRCEQLRALKRQAEVEEHGT